MNIPRASVLTSLSFALFAPLASAQTVDHSGVASMISAINAERARQNLPALAEDPRLDAVAESHSLDMARARFFSHTSPTTGQPAERVAHAGLSWNAVAENIAINQSAQAAQQSLVRSPGHYQNMIDPAQRSVGVGIVRHGDQVWVTQLFAALNGAAPVATAPVATAPIATAPITTAPAVDADDSNDEADQDCDQGDESDEADEAPASPAAPVAPVAPITSLPTIPNLTAPNAAMPWQAVPGLDQFLTGLGMTRLPTTAATTATQPNARTQPPQVYTVQTPFGPVRVEVPGAMASPSTAPAAARPAAPAPRTHRRAPARGRVVRVDTLDV